MIKKIKYALFPFLEFRENNLTKKRKVYISFNVLGFLYFTSFLSLYIFSYLFYPYDIEKNHMKIYSNDNISKDKNFLHAITNAQREVKKSVLYNDNYKVKIYIVDNPIYYIFMVTPLQINSIAANLFDNIHIKNKYIKAHTKRYQYLSKTMVHEIIHTFQAMKYGGWLRTFLIPYWVKEGYARFIEENKVVEKKPKEFLIENGVEKNYTLFALMVKHAIEKMHYSVDDLHLGKVSYDKVLNSLLDEYNITKMPSN